MRRRAKFSFATHWREQYASGQITLDQFEALIEVALRAERLPKPPKVERSPRTRAERWSAAAAASAENYAAGVNAGAWRSAA